MKSKKSSNAQASVNSSKNWIFILLIIPLLVVGVACGLISIANRDEILERTGIVTNLDGQEQIEKSSTTKVKIKATNTTTDIVLNAEVASTSEQHRIGLMNRHTLGTNEAMLFVFDRESTQSFWMKNTYIPLDIAFLDKNKQIINIHQNTIPLNEALTYNSSRPAQYVIETNAFWFEKNGIKVVSILEFSLE